MGRSEGLSLPREWIWLLGGSLLLSAIFWGGSLVLGAPPHVSTPCGGGFYPGILIYSILSPQAAQGFAFLFHVALTLAFTFLYCRRLGLSRAASALSSILFALSGVVLVQRASPPFIHALPWLPAACLFMESCRQGRRALGIIGAGVALGLVLLSGHLPVATAVLITIALLGLFFSAGERRWRPASDAALAILIGVGLGGVLLFPQAALSADVLDRAPSGIPSAAPLLNALISPRRVSGVFLGVVPLVLSVLAMVRARELSRPLWSWLQVAAVALILMLGDLTPVFSALSRAPLGWELAGLADALYLLLPMGIFFSMIVRLRHRVGPALQVLVGGGLSAVFMWVHLSLYEALYPLASEVPLFGAALEPWVFVVPLSFALAMLSGAAADQISTRWDRRRHSRPSWIRCYGIWCLAVLLIGGAALTKRGGGAVDGAPQRELTSGAAAAAAVGGEQQGFAPGDARARGMELALVISVLLSVAAAWRWPRFAVGLLASLFLVDGFTFARAEEGALRLDPGGAAHVREAIFRHALPGSRIWIEGSTGVHQLMHPRGGVWPGAPAVCSPGSIPVWDNTQPALLVRLLESEHQGVPGDLDELTRLRRLTLLGTDLMVLNSQSWQRIRETRLARPGTTGQLLARIPASVAPPEEGKEPRRSSPAPGAAPVGEVYGSSRLATSPGPAPTGAGLKLEMLDGQVAVEEQAVELLPRRFYKMEILAASPWGSSEGGIHCDLFASGYDSSDQQLDVPAHDLNRHPSRFFKIIYSGAAPKRAMFRVISSSKMPVRMVSATLTAWTTKASGYQYEKLQRLGAHRVLVRNRGALPRMWLPARAINVESEELVPGLRRGIADLHEEVVVEDLGRDITLAGGQVRQTPASRNDQIGAMVTTQGPGLVVFNEFFSRGWAARVNGRTARVLRVNGAQIAVEVPEGRSEAQLHYRPQGLTEGINRSCASLLLILLVLGRFHLGGRTSRRDSEDQEPGAGTRRFPPGSA